MKNIVLLSDGTGNSAAKRHRTNVWHLYQALERNKNQLAFYNNGVGSEGFVPLKILGGVFGIGLKRNVLELYKTLCRTYETHKNSDETYTKDKIYLFGFSRGAFTVRMLAGMIEHCGLYTNYLDEEDLRKVAEGKFAYYRERNKERGRLTSCFRRLFQRSYGEANDVQPIIEFIGVWDTVEAYGFPVGKLANFWDRRIFPLQFVNRTVPKNVRRACHALSIDDDRQTFHPVLWDEDECEDETRQIEQVWFAGTHSDIGGGYPRNDLALVTLDWMISKVETVSSQSGLQFIPETREMYRCRSDWHSRQHDSRSVVRAYYRYKPRDIDELYKKTKTKIHRGVPERIQHNIFPYAPIALPTDYQVVATPGQPQKTKADYEPDDHAEKRVEAMKKAWAVVTKRRRLYRAFVLSSVVFVLSPYILTWKLTEGAHGSPAFSTLYTGPPSGFFPISSSAGSKSCDKIHVG